MPEGAQVLCVQNQGPVHTPLPFLWAKVNTEKKLVPKKILIRGTGHPLEGDAHYIGTFQIDGGDLVFHVFERFL
jgi:hypothetical protein